MKNKISGFLLKAAFVGLALGVVPHAVFAQCLPDLSVTKTADATTASVGDTVTYTITVEEVAPNPCASTTVTTSDTFDSSTAMDLVSATSTVGTCDGTAFPVITCALGDLAPAALVTITYVVDVIGGAGTTVNNTVTVSSATTDLDPSNNTDSFAVQILAPTPIPTPTPPVVGVPELSGNGCALQLGAQAASFSAYGWGSVWLIALGVLKAKVRK